MMLALDRGRADEVEKTVGRKKPIGCLRPIGVSSA